MIGLKRTFFSVASELADGLEQGILTLRQELQISDTKVVQEGIKASECKTWIKHDARVLQKKRPRARASVNTRSKSGMKKISVEDNTQIKQLLYYGYV